MMEKLSRVVHCSAIVCRTIADWIIIFLRLFVWAFSHCPVTCQVTFELVHDVDGG